VVVAPGSPLLLDSYAGFAVDTEPPQLVMSGIANGSTVIFGEGEYRGSGSIEPSFVNFRGGLPRA
jgi:hypothetical protein